MTHSPGGYIPPANPDGVRAVLSEGEAWVGADALARYGAAFFEKLGGIPAANIHPVPDAGALPLDIRKISSITYVPIELLEEYTRQASPEEIERRRAEEQARHAREDARHAELLAAGGVVAAVAGLHSPEGNRECAGCDGATEYQPSWPCRTWTLLDEEAGR